MAFQESMDFSRSLPGLVRNRGVLKAWNHQGRQVNFRFVHFFPQFLSFPARRPQIFFAGPRPFQDRFQFTPELFPGLLFQVFQFKRSLAPEAAILHGLQFADWTVYPGIGLTRSFPADPFPKAWFAAWIGFHLSSSVLERTRDLPARLILISSSSWRPVFRGQPISIFCRRLSLSARAS